LGQAVYGELTGLRADLPHLLETDPVAYLRVKEQISQKEGKLQQIAQQRQQLVQQQQADQDREYGEYLQAEQQKLQEKLPEWRDTKVRESESSAIADMLIKHGYSQEELGTLADHRALLLARKAMMWDTQQAIRAKQATPPPQKTVPPGARNQTNANPRADDLRRKAMKTHNTQDILAYMTSKE
jgi:transglutaminase/protease-like cytokinesis protein 3